MKDTNPKDAIGTDKVPMHLWPTTATILGALAFLDGALKYGRSNFRAVGVRASIYYDAARRHLDAWFEGENADPDSGLPHLAHVLACVAIVVDAEAAGKLRDDRMVAGGWRPLMDALMPEVARLRALHRDRAARHYTIAEGPAAAAARPAAPARGGAGERVACMADDAVEAIEALLLDRREITGTAAGRSMCDCDPSVGIEGCAVCQAVGVLRAHAAGKRNAARAGTAPGDAGACEVCGFADCEELRAP